MALASGGEREEGASGTNERTNERPGRAAETAAEDVDGACRSQVRAPLSLSLSLWRLGLSLACSLSHGRTEAHDAGSDATLRKARGDGMGWDEMRRGASTSGIDSAADSGQ